MEKEIPFSQEKRSKSERLREASRRLQEFSLERRVSEAEWNAATDELTRDDFDHLQRLADGHRERAEEALREKAFQDAVDEATAAILLWPKEPAWALETTKPFRSFQKTEPRVREFLRSADKRVGKRAPRKLPPWLWSVLILVVSVPLAIGGVVLLWHPAGSGLAGGQTQGPRTLVATFDTQGIKTNIQVVQSRLLIFPEATVAELSAWVTFPEHSIELWEGTVSVLDHQGKALAHRDVVFRPAGQGRLEAGQGLEVFQQFDAWPWFDDAETFQVTTTRILAREAHPQNRQEWPLIGVETLTAGYGLNVWLQDSQWSARFASRVHTLSVEFENTGLKPFLELQFALVWRDDQGKTLKTIRFRPVSAYRTALGPGAHLGWVQESVFDTEVFSWPAGAQPHPVLELLQWQ